MHLYTAKAECDKLLEFHDTIQKLDLFLPVILMNPFKGEIVVWEILCASPSDDLHSQVNFVGLFTIAPGTIERVRRL